MKYPYTHEEYKKETLKQFKTKYPREYKRLITTDKELIYEIIKESYNGNKYKHENNIVLALDKIENEVSSCVYCLFMF